MGVLNVASHEFAPIRLRSWRMMIAQSASVSTFNVKRQQLDAPPLSD
jgi:hypothetical protein